MPKPYFRADVLNMLAKMGESLKVARLARGYTQAQMAGMLQISRKTISQVEAGSPHVASRYYGEIASLLGLCLVVEHMQRPSTGASSRLGELARLYADGKMTWREISAEADIAFGDLLVELARQELRLPQVTPSKSPEQLAMLHAIFDRAAN